MNYSHKAKLIVVSAVASAFLVGCGGENTATTSLTTLSGVAVDPELQGATVFLDANENGSLDTDELSTITDNLGNYTLLVPNSDIGKAIIVSGGIDRVTKEAFQGQMSAISVAGNNSQHITPLTTLVQKYQRANASKTVDEVKNELATKLGLSSSSDLDKNVIEDVKLLKLALQVQKVAQKVSTSSSQDITKIYETIAEKLSTDKDLSTAINSTIAAEIASGTLDEAKAKDLNRELQNSSLDNLTAEQLALSVENIDAMVESAKTEAELGKDVAQDSNVLVKTDTEVESEKGRRTLNALGLNDLDTATQENVLNKIKENSTANIDSSSLDDLRQKLDNNEFGLSESDNTKVKREQFFNDNGLQNLDKETKDDLKSKFDNDANFDFNTASNTDFQSKLGESDFLEDENLKAKIEGQMNKEQFDKVRPTGTTSLADGKLIVGSIIKGPIDGATIKLKNAEGTLITSTISENGIFVLPAQELTSSYYTIESVGGTYDDEATKTLVNIGLAQGLKTLLTKEQLTTILRNKEYIAITPETTIFADVVVNDIKNNAKDLTTARAEAEALITAAMIKDSSPLTILPGDKFLQTGDFTSSFPKDQSESFARNRAISFSYMVRDLNLDADKVFDILDLIITDYKDGKADGITLSDGRDVNVSQEFALSRTKLFQDTTAKLRNGQLSDAQKEQLNQMGFDTATFANRAGSEESNLTALVDKYINATTLPTLHTLPLLADEDGNEADAKETYTLRATTNVDVTIETPNGSWVTPMWRYNSNPLPVVIRAKNGDAMTLNFENKLASDSTIHWHGFKIPAIMDGGPDVPVAPNGTKEYSFTMNQPAAPLWFHPHPDMETGKQVYMGLAGVYLLSDTVSRELETTKQIPSGTKDTILLVQDRRFTDTVNGVRELAYKTADIDSDGMLGDTVLVNGSVLPKQEVSNTLHRYRLYNVSNARNYDFALSDGSDFTIIGTDGGLLEKPVSTNHIILGAAERVEVVIDFSKYSVGENVMLVSKAFNGDMMGMMGTAGTGSTMTSTDNMGSGNSMGSMGSGGNMGSGNTMGSGNNMGSGSTTTATSNDTMISGINNDTTTSGMLSNGTGLVIMRFDITTSEAEDITLYSTLPSTAAITTRLTEDDAINKGNEREFLMSMGGMGDMGSMQGTQGTQGMQQMSFLINNTPFKLDKVNEFVPSGATEIWSIRNMSPMAHPFHAHAIQYQILTRNGVAASGTDLGYKDTFLVQPGETVRIIGDFTSAEGDYMYHCHILEHEDAGMMGYFRVGETGNLGAQ